MQASTPPAVVVSVSAEARAERYDFHFENPSNIDPGPLVPHFFEQHYDADNVWLSAALAYTLLHAPATTTIGGAPVRTTRGSDVDTFFQPDGSIATSGTRGSVRLWSFAVRQRFALAAWRGWTTGVVVGLRRSAADFLPSDRIVVRSNPASETREPVAGREDTVVRVIDSGVTFARAGAVGRWRIALEVETLPLVRARLDVRLPDKYPGETIRGEVLAGGAEARVTLTPDRAKRWQVTASSSWSSGYRARSDFHQRSVRIGLSLRMITE